MLTAPDVNMHDICAGNRDEMHDDSANHMNFQAKGSSCHVTHRLVTVWQSCFVPLCRSPVYATFTEALDGAASIRAYDAQHRFCQLNEHQVAMAQQAAFAGLL